MTVTAKTLLRWFSPDEIFTEEMGYHVELKPIKDNKEVVFLVERTFYYINQESDLREDIYQELYHIGSNEPYLKRDLIREKLDTMSRHHSKLLSLI